VHPICNATYTGTQKIFGAPEGRKLSLNQLTWKMPSKCDRKLTPAFVVAWC